MPTFVQDPETHKLILKEDYHAHLARKDQSAYLKSDLKPFVSPIDGSIISCHSHLREHNRKHGVTDQRDYGSDWFARKKKERDADFAGNSKEARADRVESIQKAMYDHGVR